MELHSLNLQSVKSFICVFTAYNHSRKSFCNIPYVPIHCYKIFVHKLSAVHTESKRSSLCTGNKL